VGFFEVVYSTRKDDCLFSSDRVSKIKKLQDAICSILFLGVHTLSCSDDEMIILRQEEPSKMLFMFADRCAVSYLLRQGPSSTLQKNEPLKALLYHRMVP
jgi:hypothetical protein